MLLRGTAALTEAYTSGRALPGFVVYNLETVQAIVDAAEATGWPVLLQAGSSAFRHAGLRPLALLALEAARASQVPIGVHLDHSRSLEEIELCLALGYSSVMIDAARLSYEENVALTRAAVRRAHEAGAWAEAELTEISGDEDVSKAVRASAMTDPALAARFVQATGVDALAVAVGNVHGLSDPPPRIDLERLAALRRSVSVPLVIHGASGLANDALVACVKRGVAKMNFNAELRRSFLEALAKVVPEAESSNDLLSALAAARRAVAERAASITCLLAGETAAVLPAKP